MILPPPKHTSQELSDKNLGADFTTDEILIQVAQDQALDHKTVEL